LEVGAYFFLRLLVIWTDWVEKREISVRTVSKSADIEIGISRTVKRVQSTQV